MVYQAESKELYLVNHTPGVFATDDPLANPYPDRLRCKASGSNKRGVRETDAPFLMGTWDGMGDLNKNDIALHVKHGSKAIRPLDFPGHKWNHINGVSHMFSGVTCNLERNVSSSNANFGVNLQMYTQRQTKNTAMGMLIGQRYLGGDYNGIARWMSPIGIQFKWNNMMSASSATGMRFRYFDLMFADSWCPSNLLYAPTLTKGAFTNDASYYSGTNIFEGDPDHTAGNDKGGEVVLFVDEDSRDVIQDKYTSSACVGVHIAMEINEYDAAVWNKVYDFFDIKFLFDTAESTDSRIIYPEPHHLDQRLETSAKLIV